MTQGTLYQRPYLNNDLFSGHYLDERIKDRDAWQCDEEAQEVMEELQELYEIEGDLLEGYDEDPLIDNWIDEVLSILGYGTHTEVTLPDGDGYVDELLFEDPPTRRDAVSLYMDTAKTQDLFSNAVSLVEAKQFGADFSHRFSDERKYRNASDQVIFYLEKTPTNLQWGVLTDGRKWRLYYLQSLGGTQTYYEVDLLELLAEGDVEKFKYFYAFFRPSAFQKTRGKTFLDSVRAESEVAAQNLGEDLQDNVFTALRVLGKGFVEDNDLEIDVTDPQQLDELKEQSLVLLYRLMFVLYAESRGLIQPDSADAVAKYEENFSLNALRLSIHEKIGETGTGFDREFSEFSTTMWSRVTDLFRLIDEGEESMGIPPYNGGLFDEVEHEFLTEKEVSDQYLAEVIYRLSTVKNDDGRYVLADYGDLDTRHLGSVYEGLLEHQFRIAPEDYAAVSDDNNGQTWKPATEVTVADAVETVPEGGLYVVNDDGERKASGAYYTPDYVVMHMVSERVAPRLEDIRANLDARHIEPGTQRYLDEFFDGVKDLNIVDPAMGSGHFLTNTVNYLTDVVMDEVRKVDEEEALEIEEEQIRREIAKECIYGVDLNEMAVELAKLSMWLETLAADRPLAFLDHRLKTGNSLVGSDIREVLSNGDDERQATLFEDFTQTRRRTLDHVMDLMQELLAIDNETLADIKSMEEIYSEIRSDPLYQRLFELANVATAEEFGVELDPDAYERMADAIENEDDWEALRQEDWFQTAQTYAETESVFHWQLEFPEVFFDADGDVKQNSGFDVAIGNPPYFNLETTKDTAFNDYLENEFSDIYAGKADVLYFFLDHGADLIHDDGQLSFIVSRYFTEAHNAKDFREEITSKSDVIEIVDFGNNQVFPGVDTLTIVLTLGRDTDVEQTDILQLSDEIRSDASQLDNTLTALREKGDTPDGERYTIPESSFGRERWMVLPKSVREVKESVEENTTLLGEFCRTGQGMMTGRNNAFTVTDEEIEEWDIEPEVLKPLVKNGDLREFLYRGNQKQLIYLENKHIDDYPNTKEYLQQYKETLNDRAKADSVEWFRYQNPINKDVFEEYDEKIICPFIATDNRFYLDRQSLYNDGGDIEVIVQTGELDVDDRYLVAILNSTLLEFYHLNHAKLKRDGFYEYFGNSLQEIPVMDDPHSVTVDYDGFDGETAHDVLCECTERMLELRQKRHELNTDLLSYLGSYSDGESLASIGFSQLPQRVDGSILQEKKEDRPSLRSGHAEVVRESESEVEIRVTARYKPDDDRRETDPHGFVETDPLPALRISELSETEADLIEAFVPVAVDEAGGFAEYREKVTKTNSLIDRLRDLTLPQVSETASALDAYQRVKEREAELDSEINTIWGVIDEIVYDLYDLSDEEIDIVERQ